MYAIIESGGKQYKIEKGDVIDVELLEIEPEKKITIDKVLLLSDNDKLTIGQPHVAKAKVVAKVLSHNKDKKVVNFKFRHKTGYHRTRGHRQQYTRLQIEEING